MIFSPSLSEIESLFYNDTLHVEMDLHGKTYDELAKIACGNNDLCLMDTAIRAKNEGWTLLGRCDEFTFKIRDMHGFEFEFGFYSKLTTPLNKELITSWFAR